MTTSNDTEARQPRLNRGQQRRADAAARRAAREATPSYDGPHGAQDGTAWREIAPGQWKVSAHDGRVVIVESTTPLTYERAEAALEAIAETLTGLSLPSEFETPPPFVGDPTEVITTGSLGLGGITAHAPAADEGEAP